jgi:heme O synthase-like polyprenyltransferase
MGMSGRIYFVGALVLGIGLLYFGARLTTLKMPVASAASKQRARHLLQATVVYLPILFVMMMTDAKR